MEMMVVGRALENTSFTCKVEPMTSVLELTRDLKAPTCTLGWLGLSGRKWASIERPWVPNTAGGRGGSKGVSCVPTGEYRLEPHSTEAHPKVWALVNHQLDVYHWDADVPPSRVGLGRTVVLIHVANWASELRGCIAIGKTRAKDGTHGWMIQESRDAVNELRMAIGKTVDLKLVITEGL